VNPNRKKEKEITNISKNEEKQSRAYCICTGHFFSEHVIFVYEIEIKLKVRFSAKITKILAI